MLLQSKAFALMSVFSEEGQMPCFASPAKKDNGLALHLKELQIY